jgi:hypothetical protein
LSAVLVLLVADTVVTSIVSKDYGFSARQVCDYALILAALLEVVFLARGFPASQNNPTEESDGTYAGTMMIDSNKIWLLAFPKLGWIIAHANDVKQVCGCVAGQLKHPVLQPTSISRVLNVQIAAVM